MTITFFSLLPFPPKFMTTCNYCYIYTAIAYVLTYNLLSTGSIDHFKCFQNRLIVGQLWDPVPGGSWFPPSTDSYSSSRDRIVGFPLSMGSTGDAIVPSLFKRVQSWESCAQWLGLMRWHWSRKLTRGVKCLWEFSKLRRRSHLRRAPMFPFWVASVRKGWKQKARRAGTRTVWGAPQAQ